MSTSRRVCSPMQSHGKCIRKLFFACSVSIIVLYLVHRISFFFVIFPAVLQARKLMTDSLNISETLSVVDAVQDILVLLHAL